MKKKLDLESALSCISLDMTEKRYIKIVKTAKNICVSAITGFAVFLFFAVTAQAVGKPVKIKITSGGKVLTATINDSETAKDFISLLPLTLTLDDYAGKEKISYLSKKLSTKGAPSGFDPSVGDITYYAPWGNLAIFYKDHGYSNNLIKIGVFDSETDIFNVSGSVKVKIEVLKEQ